MDSGVIKTPFCNVLCHILKLSFKVNQFLLIILDGKPKIHFLGAATGSPYIVFILDFQNVMLNICDRI